MQRIWIAGLAGSGKTTLAFRLGAKLGIPVYHKDKIHWKEDWCERTEAERIALVRSFSGDDQWIYEGNSFSDSRVDGRFEGCDTIIYLQVNRLICLYRVWRRFQDGKGVVPEVHSAGCEHDFDMVAVRSILHGYPSKHAAREKLLHEAEQAGKTVIILKGRRNIKRWCEQMGI